MTYWEPTFIYSYDDYLEHHGILDQKWGIRRFQNPDGSLTEAGKRRYAKYKTRNEKYEKKVNEYRLKQDKDYRKAESIHSKKDLKARNRSMEKVTANTVKADKLYKKAAQATDNVERAKYEAKAYKKMRKAALYGEDADFYSRMTPYGDEARKYLMRSDANRLKAIKYEDKIAKNNFWIAQFDKVIDDVIAANNDYSEEYIKKYRNKGVNSI